MQTDSITSMPPPPLVFTDAAATKVSELLKEEDNPNLKLRVYISGGGCSGFQYGFTFDENSAEDDIAITNEGVTALANGLAENSTLLTLMVLPVLYLKFGGAPASSDQH